MSLWLSRLQLSPYSRNAMLLASDANRLHEAVYALFEKAVSGRILFRLDDESTGPAVLIQSGVTPDWGCLTLGKNDLRSNPESKQLEVELVKGAELSFRLLARPVRRTSSGKGNSPGPRNDLRSDEERLAWLHRKSENSGFKVTSCGLTMLTVGSVHAKSHLRTNGGSFSAVRFDGTLVATDCERLQAAIAQGIGTQKGFGFGLLSLAPP